MLNIDYDTLMEMELMDFIPLVEGNLLMEGERTQKLADKLMPYQALNTAVIMSSSGNMGKSFKIQDMAETLYPSDTFWGNSGEESPKSYEDQKESVLKRFGVKEREEDNNGK